MEENTQNSEVESPDAKQKAESIISRLIDLYFPEGDYGRDLAIASMKRNLNRGPSEMPEEEKEVEAENESE